MKNQYKLLNQVLFNLIVFLFLFQNINAVKSSFLDNQNKKTLLGKIIQQGSPTETTCSLVRNKIILIHCYELLQYVIVISLI